MNVRMSAVEERWLDHAWSVLNCPDDHRRACERNGGAVPGPGRVDGNELRWPGYLGRNYRAGSGVLCVGAVHRESTPEGEQGNSVVGQTNADLAATAREWVSAGRTQSADDLYLAQLRETYELALPEWSRWKRHFKVLVEDYLDMDVTQIAWANLAKCRVSINRGAKQRAAEAVLTPLCQRQFPMSELVEAIRPVAVLVAVLRANPGEGIVRLWESPSCSPLVFTWQGQSGHDRHNTAPGARPLRDWAPEMAHQIQDASRVRAVPAETSERTITSAAERAAAQP